MMALVCLVREQTGEGQGQSQGEVLDPEEGLYLEGDQDPGEVAWQNSFAR